MIGENGALPKWSWTTVCEDAWWKIDGDIFLHLILDGVDFRADPGRVLMHAPTSVGELKEWFAVVRGSGVTMHIPDLASAGLQLAASVSQVSFHQVLTIEGSGWMLVLGPRSTCGSLWKTYMRAVKIGSFRTWRTAADRRRSSSRSALRTVPSGSVCVEV